MKASWVKEHSLSLSIAAIFSIMVVGTLLLGPHEWKSERQFSGIGYGEAFTRSDFWHWWIFQTDLSLQADVFGALLLVLLTKHLYERKSAAAKDPPEDREE